MSIKALYGYSADLEPFQRRSPLEAAALLRDWGADAVFGGHADPAFVAAAHGAGLRVFAEFACFVGEAWWQKHPDSRPVTPDGAPLPRLEWYTGANPSHPVGRAGKSAHRPRTRRRVARFYPLAWAVGKAQITAVSDLF